MAVIQDPTNRRYIQSSDLLIGELAELQIKLSDTTGLQALDLVLAYDPAIFSIPSSTALYTTTDLTRGWTFLINTTVPGQIKIGGFSTTPLEASAGSLINLNLQVKEGIEPTTTTLDLVSASLNSAVREIRAGD